MNEGIQKGLRLAICSKARAEEILASDAAEVLTHVVSIGEPGSSAPLGFHKDEGRFAGAGLRLEFDDITVAGGWSAVMAGYQAPRPSDATALCAFFRRSVLRLTSPRVLIHCAQGISRSAAAGFALLFMHHNSAVSAAEALYALSSELHPNPLFIALLDDELKANTELVRASGLYALMQDNDEAVIERRRDEYGG